MNSRLPSLSISVIFAALCVAQTSPPQTKHSAPPIKRGVQTPGVQIPLAKLVPVAAINIAPGADWIAVDDDIWVSDKAKNIVARIDPRTNKLTQTITGFNKPCSGLAIGFDSLWVPNCGNQTVSRVNLKSGEIIKVISTGIADSEGGLSVGADSVWLLSDTRSTLTRLDPATNSVQSTLAMPPGCVSAAFAFESVWVTCPPQNTLVRVSASTNTILTTIKVGPEPRFLATGEGAVWTLNQGDGSISRIDPASNKVIATIAVGIPGEGGDIAVGEGSVWATSMGFPVSRIDPASNQVVQQFVGDGGDAIRARRGMVWLSNYKSGLEWRLDPVALQALKP